MAGIPDAREPPAKRRIDIERLRRRPATGAQRAARASPGVQPHVGPDAERRVEVQVRLRRSVLRHRGETGGQARDSCPELRHRNQGERTVASQGQRDSDDLPLARLQHHTKAGHDSRRVARVLFKAQIHHTIHHAGRRIFERERDVRRLVLALVNRFVDHRRHLDLGRIGECLRPRVTRRILVNLKIVDPQIVGCHRLALVELKPDSVAGHFVHTGRKAESVFLPRLADGKTPALCRIITIAAQQRRDPQPAILRLHPDRNGIACALLECDPAREKLAQLAVAVGHPQRARAGVESRRVDDERLERERGIPVRALIAHQLVARSIELKPAVENQVIGGRQRTGGGTDSAQDAKDGSAHGENERGIATCIAGRTRPLKRPPRKTPVLQIV